MNKTELKTRKTAAYLNKILANHCEHEKISQYYVNLFKYDSASQARCHHCAPLSFTCWIFRFGIHYELFRISALFFNPCYFNPYHSSFHLCTKPEFFLPRNLNGHVRFKRIIKFYSFRTRFCKDLRAVKMRLGQELRLEFFFC